jgi:dTDP-4-dehydrorhamnose reductase
MKILVTGANGQLGYEITKKFNTSNEVFTFSREEMDITDFEVSASIIKRIQPDLIIHCAAYTAVDKAEVDKDLAFLVNYAATKNISLCAEEIGATLCYISTDYVFDGLTSVPYLEHDETKPINIYGKSKRTGEIAVETFCSKFFIIRTSWLYGEYGSNFVKTMIRLAETNNSIRVVNDQIGTPTYTEDLANFIFDLVQTKHYGIYHASNEGECSWFDFAQAIFEIRKLAVKAEPCSTNEFPRLACRPSYSVLDNLNIRIHGFKDLRPWREALEDFLGRE